MSAKPGKMCNKQIAIRIGSVPNRRHWPKVSVVVAELRSASGLGVCRGSNN